MNSYAPSIHLPASVFDTHSFVKKLVSVGMPEPQAEVIATEHVRLNTELVNRDFLRYELGALEQRLKNELTIRFGAMIFALGGFLVAVKYLG